MTDQQEWNPKVGDVVCDCRYRHLPIAAIDPEDNDTVTFEDGSMVSLAHCCWPVPHPGLEHT